MSDCPKCGSKASMRGPKYVNDDMKGERLVTKCQVCKYTVEKPCADKAEQPYNFGRVKVELAPEPEPSDESLGVKGQ